MCGIAGVWYRGSDRSVDRALLSRMASAVRHRGPDDAGHMVDRGFGMAHQRLAILDLSPAGRQPMTTPDGRYTIVFNGEIYNYRELKAKYCKGIRLRSTSDTEVLLHVLAQRGEAALLALRGMFALALWDRRKEQLLLARDPFGQKPLYYAVRGNCFLFASEVKALLESSLVSREVTAEALTKYFLYEYVPAPATGYRDVWQVPMGHYAVVTGKTVNVRRWWKPVYQPKQVFKTEGEAMKILDEKLFQAVERRMIADVPVGVLLSGGLDSTAIS